MTTGELEAELKGHMDYVRSVAFAKDGNRVASGSDDGTVRIWNMTTGEAEARLSHSDSVKSVAFSWDGNQVVFGSRDQSVWIWNVMTKEVEGPYETCDVCCILSGWQLSCLWINSLNLECDNRRGRI